MGVELAETGFYGPGFAGPAALLILVVYRILEALKNKHQHGTFVNYEKSNWFKKNGTFIRKNLWPLAGNFIPNLAGLIVLSLGMKYATLGGVN